MTHAREDPEPEREGLDLAAYDSARPWSVPYDSGPRTLLEVAIAERDRNLRWLLTLAGLRLVATAWLHRLQDPATWIGLERLLGTDRAAALPLAKEYARAQEQRQALIDASPAAMGPGFRSRGLDPDDGPRVVRAWEGLLQRHEGRFAPGWHELAGECPDARGWAGVLELLPGEVRQWSVISSEVPGLAAELGVPTRPMLDALRREKRLVVRVKGWRVSALNPVRTPRGRVRCYRYRDCPLGAVISPTPTPGARRAAAGG